MLTLIKIQILFSFLAIFLCASCPDNYYLTPDSTCSTICPIGYYRNTLTHTCIKCITNCSKCESDKYCQECKESFTNTIQYNFKLSNLQIPTLIYDDNYSDFEFSFSDNGLKLTVIKENTVYTLKNKKETSFSSFCKKCLYPCNSCNIIISRNQNYQACTSCVEGTMKEISFSDGTVSCIPCFENCVNCSGDSKETQICNFCQEEFIYDSSLNACISGKCPNNCQYCYKESEFSEVRCSKCYDGYYMQNEICTSCPENCSSCKVVFDTTGIQQVSCESCIDEYYLDYFENQQICQPCNHGCKSCSKYFDEMICDTCYNSYYINSTDYGSCIQCDPNCLECSSTEQCATCNTGYLLKSGFCVDSCGDEYFNVDSTCLPCQKNCKNCQDELSCQLCKKSYVILDQSCIKNCPDYGYYISDGHCLPCSVECTTCFGQTDDMCLSCTENYYLRNNSCIFIEECQQGTTDCICNCEPECAASNSNIASCFACANDFLQIFNKTQNVSFCVKSDEYFGYFYTDQINSAGYIHYITTPILEVNLFLYKGNDLVTELPPEGNYKLTFIKNFIENYPVLYQPTNFTGFNSILINTTNIFKGNNIHYELKFEAIDLNFSANIFFWEGGANLNLTYFPIDDWIYKVSSKNITLLPESKYSIDVYLDNDIIFQQIDLTNSDLEIYFTTLMMSADSFLAINLYNDYFFYRTTSNISYPLNIEASVQQSAIIELLNSLRLDTATATNLTNTILVNLLAFKSIGAFFPYQIDMITREIRSKVYRNYELQNNSNISCEFLLCPANSYCTPDNQTGFGVCVCNSGYEKEFCVLTSDQFHLASQIINYLNKVISLNITSAYSAVQSIYTVVVLKILSDDFTNYELLVDFWKGIDISQLSLADIWKYYDTSYFLFLWSKLQGAQDFSFYLSSFEDTIHYFLFYNLKLCTNESGTEYFQHYEDDYLIQVSSINQTTKKPFKISNELNGMNIAINFDDWLLEEIIDYVWDSNDIIMLAFVYSIRPYVQGTNTMQDITPSGGLMYQLYSCKNKEQINIFDLPLNYFEEKTTDLSTKKPVAELNLCFSNTLQDFTYSTSYYCGKYNVINGDYYEVLLNEDSISLDQSTLCCILNETGYFTTFANSTFFGSIQSIFSNSDYLFISMFVIIFIAFIHTIL